jgi:uncharacterized XkdX family phage protein
MITFENYKLMYEWNWYDDETLKKPVNLGKLTPDQYKEITGVDYAW